MAVLPRAESAAVIKHRLDRQLRGGCWPDPLLYFIWQTEHKSRDRFSETVNLVGLFSCQASLVEWLERPFTIQRRFKQQLTNARELSPIIEESGWCPAPPSACFRSGIVLLRANTAGGERRHADVMRERFQRLGIAVTTYTDGSTRLSMPTEPWRPSTLHYVQVVLRRCIGRQPSPYTINRTTDPQHVPQTLAL
jgi:hypothetical protein